jgi:hypothetical protein
MKAESKSRPSDFLFLLRCPICNIKARDPSALREHRLQAHQNIYAVKKGL